MNVLYISYNGAMEPVFQSQGLPYLYGLAKRRERITLLTFEKAGNCRDIKGISELKNRLKESGIDWHYLYYHKKPKFLSSFYDIFCGSLYAAFLVISKKIGLIHARSYCAAAMAYILHVFLRTKYIFDMRGMMIDEFVDAGALGRDCLVYLLARRLEKKMLLSASQIIVLTEKISRVIKEMPFLKNKSLRIEVIPCCADLARFRPQKGERLSSDFALKGKFVFLYIGSVGTWYFLEGMLDYVKTAKMFFPDMHFLIFNAAQRDLIRAEVTRRNFDTRDITITYVPHSRISEYIPECAVGLIFYKQTFSRLACSPIKFAEYLASGLPVVVSPGVGDTASIVESERVGVVIEEFSDASYRESLNKLRSLLKEGETLSKRCRLTAEKYFSLEGGIEKYQRIYDEN